MKLFQLSSAKFQPFCSVPSKPIAYKLAALGFQQINIAGRNLLIVRLRDFFAVKSIVDLSLKQRTKIIFSAWWHKCTLRWRHNETGGVSNQQRHDCLLDSLFMRRSKKTTKLRVTDLCNENSPVTGEFPAQRASNAENVSIWWRQHVNNESAA